MVTTTGKLIYASRDHERDVRRSRDIELETDLLLSELGAIGTGHETGIPPRDSVHPLVRPSGKLFQVGLREKLVDRAVPGDLSCH